MRLSGILAVSAGVIKLPQGFYGLASPAGLRWDTGVWGKIGFLNWQVWGRVYNERLAESPAHLFLSNLPAWWPHTARTGAGCESEQPFQWLSSQMQEEKKDWKQLSHVCSPIPWPFPLWSVVHVGVHPSQSYKHHQKENKFLQKATLAHNCWFILRFQVLPDEVPCIIPQNPRV